MMVPIFYILLGVGLLLVLTILWKRRWLYYHSYKAPGPFAWPIIGNIPNLMGDVDERVEKALKLTMEHKPLCRIWVGPLLFYGLTRPEDYQIILNKHLDRNFIYDLMVCATGRSLLTAPVDLWKKNRKLMNPTFNQQILNDYVSRFEEKSLLFFKAIEGIQPGTYVDAYPYLHSHALEILSATFMNIDDGMQHFMHDIKRGLVLVENRLYNILFIPDIIWSICSFGRELKAIITRVRLYIDEELVYKRQHVIHYDETIDNGEKKCWLDHIVALGNAIFPDKQISDECILFTVAGTDTTTHSNGYTLLLLGMHPEVQELVHQEVISVLGESKRSVTYQDLPKFVYLEQVIKESLRLFPTIPLGFRYMTKDVYLEPYTIPKGASVMYAPILLHRDPDYWSDPLKFDPDRFLPEEVAKRDPRIYIPFASGSRNCIGWQYGLMSMKHLIASIVRDYKVYTTIKSVEEIDFGVPIVLRSKKGYPIKFERRL